MDKVIFFLTIETVIKKYICSTIYNCLTRRLDDDEV